MKNSFSGGLLGRTGALIAGLLIAGGFSGFSQFGPPGGGASARMSTADMKQFAKLFGDNKEFSASVLIEAEVPGSEKPVSLPGKMAFRDGQTRFELDMTDAKGGNISPEMMAQIKSMGMARMVSISRPDQKLSYVVYPDLQVYAKQSTSDTDREEKEGKFETTEVGKEKVDGHDCIKNQVKITDSTGKTREATVWNATNLKKFPVKIVQLDNGRATTLRFSDVKLAKPDGKLFEPPADFKAYDNMQQMMQEQMMKRFQGGQGFPPQRP